MVTDQVAVGPPPVVVRDASGLTQPTARTNVVAPEVLTVSAGAAAALKGAASTVPEKVTAPLPVAMVVSPARVVVPATDTAPSWVV